MNLTDSPLSSVHLRTGPKRFETLLGFCIEEFDALFEKVYDAELAFQYARHPLWTPDRVERLVVRYQPILREHLCVTLLHMRQYSIQEVVAASFGLSQGHVSRIINRILPLLSRVLPTPQITVEALTAWLETLPPELRKEYAATLIVDASEQRIERSLEESQQKKDYSGKKSAIAVNCSLSSH